MARCVNDAKGKIISSLIVLAVIKEDTGRLKMDRTAEKQGGVGFGVIQHGKIARVKQETPGSGPPSFHSPRAPIGRSGMVAKKFDERGAGPGTASGPKEGSKKSCRVENNSSCNRLEAFQAGNQDQE